MLAGAVWAAACTGLWWMLPVVPLMIVNFREGTRILGISPSHGVALTQPNSDWREVAANALEITDLASTQTIRTLAKPAGVVEVVGRSANDSVWLLVEHLQPNQRIFKLDLKSQSLIQLPVPIAPVGQSRLSSMGDYAAFYDGRDEALVLWDLNKNRLHGQFSKLAPLYEFSRDGRCVAGIDGWNSLLRIIDIESKTFRAEIAWPHKMHLDRYALDYEGNRVAGVLREWDEGAFGGIIAQLIMCWDTRLPRPHVLDRMTNGEDGGWQDSEVKEVHFGPRDKDLFVTLRSAGVFGFRCIDMTSRALVTDRFEEFAFGSELSPDGRVVMADIPVSPECILDEWAAKLGVRSPFRQRDGVRLFDSRTGRHLGQVPRVGSGSFATSPELDCYPLTWSADGQYLIAQSYASAPEVRIYDIPPRKSLTWFAAGAALLAMPLAWLARRRVRKLGAVAA